MEGIHRVGLAGSRCFNITNVPNNLLGRKVERIVTCNTAKEKRERKKSQSHLYSTSEKG